MEHSEIVQVLSEKFQLSKNETRRILQSIVKILTEKLSGNVRFTIPGFGTFGTKIRKQRRAFNPQTKSFMLLPKKNTVFFRLELDFLNQGSAKTTATNNNVLCCPTTSNQH